MILSFLLRAFWALAWGYVAFNFLFVVSLLVSRRFERGRIVITYMVRLVENGFRNPLHAPLPAHYLATTAEDDDSSSSGDGDGDNDSVGDADSDDGFENVQVTLRCRKMTAPAADAAPPIISSHDFAPLT